MTISSSSPTSMVKAWQAFLNTQNCPAGTPDGIWGANTESASKKFQSDNGLTADGIVGSQTISTAESKGFEIPKPKEFQPPGNLNAIFDISHLNGNVDLSKAKATGMSAVFHKATQSVGSHLFYDKMFPIRKKEAQAAGLFWGAYHFGTGGDGTEQAKAFLDYVSPHDDTLLALDFESCTTSGESTMGLDEAKAFVTEVKKQTGKYPGIYGGSYLRQAMENNADPVLTQCWLWVAQYASGPHLPNGWEDYTFWQFTDGRHGPGALPIAGVGHCDRDLFRGDVSGLEAFWRAHKV